MYRKVTLVCAVSAALSPFALAADLLVPQEFATIQAAIAAAESGDRVLIAPGTYVGSIDFLGKAIIVEGAEGAESTVIDGDGAPGHVVNFVSGESRSALLRGVTITGGFGEPGSLGAGPGGGIRIMGAAPTIESCIIAFNQGITGGGIESTMGDPLIVGTRFEFNHALHGGGLYAESGSVTVLDSVFHGNTATNFGGAIAIFGGIVTSLADSTFTANAANSFGGAIYTNTTTLDAARLTFTGNGEGSPFGEEGDAYLFSTFGGGAIYTTNTNGRLEASRMSGNIAFAGGGLYVAGGGGLEVVNSLINANVAALSEVYCNASSPTLINCTILSDDGFGIFTTFGAFPSVANSIVRGGGYFNAVAGNGETTLSNSIAQGTLFNVALGDGVVNADPLLDENFSPLPGSPAIDAGDNAAVPAAITTDLLGNDRFVDALGNGPIVDIGAIEFVADVPEVPPVDRRLLGTPSFTRPRSHDSGASPGR